jgi:polyisoprenoid-binding protein YceI
MARKKWTVDKAHSQIRFKVKHLMITTVAGNFTDYDVSVETEDDDFTTARILFTAQTNSVFTGSVERDAHIKSPDFFDVEKYPELKFVSASIEKKKENTYRLQGDITIKNKTKKLLLNVEFTGFVIDPWGKNKAGFIVTGKLKRKKFGLLWNVITDAGSALVGEEVKIECEVQFTPAE